MKENDERKMGQGIGFYLKVAEAGDGFYTKLPLGDAKRPTAVAKYIGESGTDEVGNIRYWFSMFIPYQDRKTCILEYNSAGECVGYDGQWGRYGDFDLLRPVAHDLARLRFSKVMEEVFSYSLWHNALANSDGLKDTCRKYGAIYGVSDCFIDGAYPTNDGSSADMVYKCDVTLRFRRSTHMEGCQVKTRMPEHSGGGFLVKYSDVNNNAFLGFLVEGVDCRTCADAKEWLAGGEKRHFYIVANPFQMVAGRPRLREGYLRMRGVSDARDQDAELREFNEIVEKNSLSEKYMYLKHQWVEDFGYAFGAVYPVR